MTEFLMTVATIGLVFALGTVLVALCAVGIIKVFRAVKQRHAHQA